MSLEQGVELTGYLSAAVGVGEAARRYLGALRSAGVPVLATDVPLGGRDPAQTPLASGPSPAPGTIGAELLCLNPEQMVPYLDARPGPGRPTTIALWSWEVDVVPG